VGPATAEKLNGVTLIVVAVVLCDFWWLWIREFLDEPGTDARRLVEQFAALWTAVAGNLDFSVWIRSVTPFRVMAGFSARRATIGPWLFVVLVPVGRGRLFFIGLLLARWRMRSFVPPEFGSEALVLLMKLLILLLELFFLLLKLINTIFESSESFKQLLHFLVSDHRNSPRPVQTTRDGLP